MWSRACSSMLFVSFSSFRLSSLFSLSRRLTLIMMMMRRSRMIMMMLHYPDIKVIIFKRTHVKNTLDNKTVNTMMTIWGKWPRVRKIKKIDGRISALLLKTMLLSSFEPLPRHPCESNIQFRPISSCGVSEYVHSLGDFVLHFHTLPSKISHTHSQPGRTDFTHLCSSDILYRAYLLR